MEHRNLIAALCMISAFILPINAELKYVDASRLTLIGKVMPTPENVYHRVDTVKYNVSSKAVVYAFGRIGR